MSLIGLASLLEFMEFVSINPQKFPFDISGRNSLISLKQRVTGLYMSLKGLENRFEYDEIVKNRKEQIRAMVSDVEYSFLEIPSSYLFIESIIEEICSMYRKEMRWFQDHLSSLSPAEEAPGQMFEDGNIPALEVAAINKNFSSVGLEESLKQLVQELTGSSKELERVGIVGMAGIGKTTLARMVFEDPCIIQHFDLLGWVKTSQTHSKSDMLLQVLKCINQQNFYDIRGQPDDALEEDLYRSLKGQRYLIVVDDLWSVQAWNEMRRTCSDDSMGSRILFTSRQSSVIKDLNCKKIHLMSLLDEQTSWDLLQKKVFGQNTCPPDLVAIGKRITTKCQGLPLAIVVIAGILLKSNMNLESWKVIEESFSSLALSSSNPCQQMFALSYKHLPAHLKSCFLYMGAFPGGAFEIKSQLLTRLWIAEGFVGSMNSENLEQVADEYLRDLIDRNLVLAASKRSNGNVKSCRLHDLLLNFCIKQARADKFLDVIKDIDEVPENNVSREKNYRPCQICLSPNTFGGTPLKHQRPGRISFHCNTFENIPPQSQARAALFTTCSLEIPDILLYVLDFKLLVVLDMIPLRFDSFPEEQVCRLLLLKYLALTASSELPTAVFILLKLQTLIVNDSRITSDTTAALALPLEFWGSLNLRHMQLQVANYLPPPTDEFILKQLVSLRTLSKVTLSSFSSLESFTCIPNVKKLGVGETMEDLQTDHLWNKFFENLACLSHLEILKLYCLQLNNCSPRILPIPSPNAFPETLRKLTLSRSHLPWEEMKTLSELPNLEVLKLRNYAFQGAEWKMQGEGFQRLSYLLIEYTDVQRWSFEDDECFPRLQRLVLKFCHLLEEIPEQIGDIPTLSCIELRHCSNTLEESVRYVQEQQEEFGHNIEVHIRRKIIRH